MAYPFLMGIGDSVSPGYAAFNSSRHQLSGIARRRIEHMEENAGAAAVALSDQETAEMDRLFPIGVAAGSNRPTIVQDVEAGR